MVSRLFVGIVSLLNTLGYSSSSDSELRLLAQIPQAVIVSVP